MKRYSVNTDSSETFQGMIEDQDGDYVEYDDIVGIANSRLMAASPELLEALQATLEWMEFTIEQLAGHDKGARLNYGGPLSKARAAIKKATRNQ